MNRVLRSTAIVGLLSITAAACGSDGNGSSEDADAPDDHHTHVTFESPADGERIAGGVDVTMAATGIEIEPAGEVRSGAGHFHVIADAGCVDPGTAIAKDANHVHFGSGTGAGTVYLTPGTHTLCLQVGDGQHAALGITDEIEVEVGIASREEFCDVVAEADTVADSAPDDDFDAARTSAANASRLVQQLQAATAYVDDDVRAEVEQFLDYTAALMTGMANAEDEAAAEALWSELALSEADAARIEGAALPWVEATCGVSVD